MRNAIFGLILIAIMASGVYLILMFLKVLWEGVSKMYYTFYPKKEEGTEFTDAQHAALKKEFVWVEGEVIVYPLATYLNYTIFKCGQGHTAYVMFRGDKLVDTITFDFEVLVDEPFGVLFKLDKNNLHSGSFYVRRT